VDARPRNHPSGDWRRCLLEGFTGSRVSGGPPQPIPVIAATVQKRDVPIVLTGLGVVTPLNTATVRSQITGLIISVNFKEGQFVKQGDLLAQIDPRTYQAQLDQAEATLAHGRRRRIR
jgi:multidrug efflux system membrane fusion protein